MLRQEPKQTSFHYILYNKIPENHILKRIESVVDFSFINDLLKEKYCLKFGRPAKEPELMCKLLFLQHLYNLGDRDVIEQARLNLAYMYFLGINPEDELPERSLLSKFITEIVRQCVDKKIIKGTSVSIDATHIEANTIKKTPERLMKHLARKIVNTYKTETEKDLENMPDIPEYKKIEDYNEAKVVMKNYLNTVIAKVEEKVSSDHTENIKTQEIIKKAKNILKDPKFMKQKGVRSLIDEDARVGRKSKTQSLLA